MLIILYGDFEAIVVGVFNVQSTSSTTLKPLTGEVISTDHHVLVAPAERWDTLGSK